MLWCMKSENARDAYARYVRECALAACFGSDDVRRLFLRRYERMLGAPASWIFEMGDEQREEVFRDAVRARDGRLPQTLVGLRLAVPSGFVPAVQDPFTVWEGAPCLHPAGVAVDPVCGMFVDPGETPYRIKDEQWELYFCCPHCLALFGDRLLRGA